MVAMRHLLICLAVALAFLAPVFAEDEKKDEPKSEPKKERPTFGTRQSEGVGREGMWPAPTAEDWAKPVLIQFQRTWEDAVAVSKETGKPILCCINMDGEIASEHYAGVRYREAAIAEIYKPYVCVIASVYRHNPRDYDDKGNRILCPRFGSVTCGEHISIEPVLYEKFLDGQRVAPRHIMVDLDGKEVYDVYYVNDTAGVFDAIYDGPSKVPPPKPPIIRGDRPLAERVASRHIEDRLAVEEAYKKGDAALRKRLLEAASQNPDAAQLDLLRLAVFGLDVDASKTAREALAKTKAPAATELISEALQSPMDAKERDALIATLKRLGEGSALAKWLAGVHKGLGAKSKAVDPKAWAEAAATGSYPAPKPDGHTLSSRAEAHARAAYEKPDDPEPRLKYAEANLKLALEAPRTYATNPNFGKRVARHLYVEAKKAGLEAEKLGAKGWRVNCVLALAAYYTGDLEAGYKRADAAMKELPPGESGWDSMALVTVFAESRWKAIKKAVRANEEWPPEWLADVHAAYAVLRKHPLGTDQQVVWHYELLLWLGARHKATGVLYDGLERFRDSEALHQRLRQRMLRRYGPKGLEAAYGRILKKYDDPARLQAFAAIASIVAGDTWRRMRRNEPALEAYQRAIEHYEKAVAAYAGHKAGADHTIALAHAARARIYYQQDDDAKALDEILASFARSPGSAGSRDGIGTTPGETAQMLLARLEKSPEDGPAKKLTEALAKIDPGLLAPDIGLTGK